MADRESTFIVKFDGEAGDLAAALTALKRSVGSAVADIERQTGQVELFKSTKAKVEETGAAFLKLTDRAAEFRRQIAEIEGAGGKVGAELTAALKATEKQIAQTSREYNRQADSLAKLEGSLTKAGVDVSKLAAEEQRLAAAAKEAAVAQAEQQARATLGIKSANETREAIAKLGAAYNLLRDSGKLTFGELSAAQAGLQTKTTEARQAFGSLGSAFASVRTALLGVTASFAAVTAAIANSIGEAKKFADALGKVRSISRVTGPELERLTEGARSISREFGLDAAEGLEALFQVLRQGIPADNALDVLNAAALAAQASVTDLGTAVRLTTTLVNAFGVPASQLEGVLDRLFEASKSGGATFDELAASLGEIAPIARAAGVPLDTITAAITTLKRSGIDAPAAFTALSKAIAQLSAPTAEVAERLRLAGIEATGFFGIIEEIARKKLSLDQLRDLVDAKTLKAVAALASDFGGLNEQLARLATSVGGLRAANAEIEKTPTEKLRDFKAAISDLQVAFGEFVKGSGSRLLSQITEAINGFNAMSKASKTLAFEVAALGGAFVVGTLAIKAMSTPINVLGAMLPSLGGAFAKLTAGLTAATLVMRAFGIAAAALISYEIGKWATENVPAVRQLADVISTVFASAVNTLVYAAQAFKAILSLDFKALREASAQWQANARVIGEDFSNALSGATRRIQEARLAQEKLTEQLEATARKAREAATGVGDALRGIAGGIDAQLNAVTVTIDNLVTKLGGLTASLQQRAQAAQASVQQVLVGIQAEAEARIAALDKSQAAEIASAQARTEIERQASRDRLAAITQFAAQTTAAFEAEASARLEVAKRQPEQLAKVEAEIAQRKRDTLAQVVAAYRAHIQTLGQLEESHLAKIREIQEKRRLLNATVEEKIRALRREGLTEAEKYADRILEIDQLLSRARQAAAQGDLKLAEQLAEKAFALVDQIGRAVVDNGREVVSSFEAQQTAVDKYREAANVLNRVLDVREQNETDAGKAATEGIADAQRALAGYNRELQQATKDAEKGITVGINLDLQAVDTALRELDERLATRETLLAVKLDVEAAIAEAERLKTALREGFTDGAEQITAGLAQRLQDLAAAAPQFAGEIAKAAGSLADVVEQIGTLKATELKIETNAEEVRQALDTLDGREMRATLTVDVKVTGDKLPEGVTLPIAANRGGLIPERVRAAFRLAQTPIAQFARGGPVFTGRKVPGSGNTDTYPATLEGGSFVVRKSASRHYGDALMAAIAGLRQRFAGGGPVSPLLGGVTGSALLGGPIGDRFRLSGGTLREIIAEAFRIISPLLDIARTLPRSNTGQNFGEFLERRLALILDARTLAEAEELLAPLREAFDNLLATLREAARRGVPVVVGAEAKEADPRAGFARGGAARGTDTVPAMLTPGEWVVPRATVQRLGSGFLAALNDMRVPRATLARLIPTAPTPRPLYFAGGGPVPGVRSAASPSGSTFGNTYNVTIQASAASILTPDNVHRLIEPVLRDFERRRA